MFVPRVQSECTASSNGIRDDRVEDNEDKDLSGDHRLLIDHYFDDYVFVLVTSTHIRWYDMPIQSVLCSVWPSIVRVVKPVLSIRWAFSGSAKRVTIGMSPAYLRSEERLESGPALRLGLEVGAYR